MSLWETDKNSINRGNPSINAVDLIIRGAHGSSGVAYRDESLYSALAGSLVLKDDQLLVNRTDGTTIVIVGRQADGSWLGITADSIEANTITGTHINALDLTSKTLIADTGTIGGWSMGATELAGPVGAIIRSGQTDFQVGTGFWLGNVAGVPKFSIGSASGNQMSWDGTTLRYTGSLAASSVINTYTYTTATLPQPPTSVGFNNASAVE